MEIIIRKMIDRDLPQAMAILEKWHMAPQSPSDTVPDPERSGLDIARSFVAVHGDTVVGVASYLLVSDTVAETASLAVAPGYQGQGVGYQLQVSRLQAIKEAGINTVRTETDRPATIAWYIRKFNYRIIGTNPKKHAFSLPDVAEWTVLELDLTQW